MFTSVLEQPILYYFFIHCVLKSVICFGLGVFFFHLSGYLLTLDVSASMIGKKTFDRLVIEQIAFSILSGLIFFSLGHHYSLPIIIPYGLLCAALLITAYTDFQALVIFRLCTLYLIPIAWLCAWYNWIPVTLFESFFSAGASYALLMGIATLFYALTGKEGLGYGDAELLATIAAFTGFAFAWYSLFLGALLGSFIGIFLILIGRASRTTLLPLGTCIAFVATVLLSANIDLTILLF